MATYPTLRRSESIRARSNINKKPDTGSHTPATNDLDLSSHNSVNGSSICQQEPKDIFTSLEFVNEANEKEKRLQDEGIEGTKV